MIWPHLFIGVILYSLFDGFLGLIYHSPLMLLSRDFLVCILYLFYAIEMRSSQYFNDFSRSLGGWTIGLLSFFLINGVLQIFNPNSFGLLTGILGLKVMFLNWGFMLVAFSFVNSREDVIRFFKIVVLASVLINLFGVYQHMMGPVWLFSTFGPGVRRLFTYEGEMFTTTFFRVPGTFASGGIYATFLVANFAFVAILASIASVRRDKILWFFCGALNVFALIVTGTRGAILYIIMGIIIYGLISRNIKNTFFAVLIFGLLFVVGVRWFGAATASRYETLKNVEMIKDRTYRATGGLFAKYMNKYPMGKGLGTASQQVRHLPGLEGKKWELVENYPSKLLVETGVAGVVLFYCFVITIILNWLDWLRYLNKDARNILLPLAVFSIVILVVAQNGIESSPTALFLWTCIGFGAKIGWLEKKEIEERYYS